MNNSKKKIQKKSIEKQAFDFYKRYAVSSFDVVTKNDFLKQNGNFKYIWDFNYNQNADVNTTTLIFVKI